MRKYGTRKGHSKKNRRGTKKTQRRRKQRTSRKQLFGGCGGGVCQAMVGGEDPQLSTSIHNYVMSELPHSVV